MKTGTIFVNDPSIFPIAHNFYCMNFVIMFDLYRTHLHTTVIIGRTKKASMLSRQQDSVMPPRPNQQLFGFQILVR